VINTAISVKESAVGVHKVNTRRLRGRNTHGHPHNIVSEVRVHGDAMASEICHIISNVETGITSTCVILLSHVIGQLRLVEENFTVVAVPLDKITKSVLREEAINSDIVSVNLKAILDVVV